MGENGNLDQSDSGQWPMWTCCKSQASMTNRRVDVGCNRKMFLS